MGFIFNAIRFIFMRKTKNRIIKENRYLLYPDS